MGKGLRGFLGQIVPDIALNDPVLVFARKFPGVGAAVRVWCTVGIAFKSYGRYGDERPLGKPLLQVIIFRLAFSQAEPPAVVVDDDVDVVRVLEGCRRPIERCVVEVPLRRGKLPDELVEVVGVLTVAEPATFGGKGCLPASRLPIR